MGTTEEELNKILKSNKCKTVKIDGKNYWISKKVKEAVKKHISENETKSGGFLPLLGLIPGIIAGIGGAAGIASGVAGAVASSREAIKKQKEIQILDRTLRDQELKKNETTNPTTTSETNKGSGLYLNPSQATAMHKYFKNNTDIPPEITKKFKDGVEIEIETNGDGLYLKPFKNGD